MGKNPYHWDYFTKTSEEHMARCKICLDIFSYKSTTSNLKKHLEKRHPEVCPAPNNLMEYHTIKPEIGNYSNEDSVGYSIDQSPNPRSNENGSDQMVSHAKQSWNTAPPVKLPSDRDAVHPKTDHNIRLSEPITLKHRKIKRLNKSHNAIENNYTRKYLESCGTAFIQGLLALPPDEAIKLANKSLTMVSESMLSVGNQYLNAAKHQMPYGSDSSDGEIEFTNPL